MKVKVKSTGQIIEIADTPVVSTNGALHWNVRDILFHPSRNKNVIEIPKETIMTECPLCEFGTLTPVKYTDEFMAVPREPDKGYIKVEDLQGMRCTNCTDIIIMTDQIRHNERLINETRMKHSMR